jgi:hypothetical protein
MSKPWKQDEGADYFPACPPQTKGQKAANVSPLAAFGEGANF